MTTKSTGEGYVNRSYNFDLLDPSGTLIQRYNRSMPYTAKKRSHVGADTPNYWALKKRGGIMPVNDFSQEEYDMWCNGHGTYTNSQGYVYTGSGFNSLHDYVYPGPGDVARYLSDVNFDLLQQEAHASLMDSFDVLTWVAELRKLPALFSGSVVTLIRLLGDPSSYKLIMSPRSEVLADAYLELRYAWRPLIYDMRSIQNILNKGAWRNEIIKKRRGQSFGLSNQITGIYPSDGAISATYHRFDTVMVSAHSSVLAKMAGPRLNANVMLTTWELIPYSFVIDWFLGVQRALNALQAVQLHPEAVSWNGYRVDINFTGFADVVAQPGWTASADMTSGGSYSVVKRWSDPSTNLKPQFNLHLNSWKVLDLYTMISRAIERSLSRKT